MQAGASLEARVLNRADLPLLMPRTTPPHPVARRCFRPGLEPGAPLIHWRPSRSADPELDNPASVTRTTASAMADLLLLGALLAVVALLFWLTAGSDDDDNGGGLMQPLGVQPAMVPVRVNRR